MLTCLLVKKRSDAGGDKKNCERQKIIKVLKKLAGNAQVGQTKSCSRKKGGKLQAAAEEEGVVS